MSGILSQLGHLFAQTTPTVIFVFLLLVILDRLFFEPLTTVLKKREEATRGALARAEEQMATVRAKSAEYEARFQAARQDVYRLREADRQAVLAERARALASAREQAESWLKEAQAAIAREADAARAELSATSRSLALEIADTILGEGSAPGRAGGIRP